MASKSRENEISRDDVITGKQGIIFFERSSIANHFFLKHHDLKITQKIDISYFLLLCDKKKSEARDHWNPFFYKHTQIINH